MPIEITMAGWLERLQSSGRYTFTRLEAESGTGRSVPLVQAALRRQKEQGRIVSPRRGFYVLVPPEYRATGSPPATWFIDDLMRDLDQPYYVGILSAAAIHGAAHQQPMVFQVVTNRPTRSIRAGKVTINFSMNSKLEQMPVTDVQTETGTMRVAIPESTAFDLVRYPIAAGHLSNAATVLAELAERMDPNTLVEVAKLVRLPDVQRLGFVLEAIDEHDLASPLADWLESRRPRTVLLHSGGPSDAAVDKRWHIRPNVELDVDL